MSELEFTPCEFKTFLAEYPFEGATWFLEIKARSHAEAEARVKAMPWAKVKGEVHAVIPAYPTVKPMLRIWCWLRNAFARAA